VKLLLPELYVSFVVLNDPWFVVWLLESLITMSPETSLKVPPETVTPVASLNIGMVLVLRDERWWAIRRSHPTLAF